MQLIKCKHLKTNRNTKTKVEKLMDYAKAEGKGRALQKDP